MPIERIKKRIKSEPNLLAFITLFSFSTSARGLQFLLPLFISAFFKPNSEIDFYFYWSNQINLIATLISAIWPTTLVAIIVKVKSRLGAGDCAVFCGYLCKAYAIFAILSSLITALMAESGFLGGPIVQTNNVFLIVLVSTLCVSFALGLAEIGTANREFAIAYKGILANAVVQLLIVSVYLNPQSLSLALLAGSCAQLISTVFLLKKKHLDLRTKVSKSARHSFNQFLPAARTIALLYLGNFMAATTSHLSFRIISDQVGAISAFAVASMLALAPQQLLIQQLSTVAGVSIAESYQKHQRDVANSDFLRVVFNWRKRLFSSALLSAILVAACGLLLSVLFGTILSDNPHWETVSNMTVFLSLALAAGGLNTWVARLNVGIERIESGVYFQMASNLLLIALMIIASQFITPYSSCMALLLFSLLQIPSLEIFVSYLLRPRAKFKA